MRTSMYTVSELSDMVEGSTNYDDGLLNDLQSDPRKGVQQLYNRLKNQLVAQEKEQARLWNFNAMEREMRAKGYKLVCGVDEVGRGPIAGPVVAVAAVFKEDILISGLDDSKKLTPHKRKELATAIKGTAVSWAYGVVGVSEIDRMNIHKATLKAMSRAVHKLRSKPDFILVDALTIPEITIPQRKVIHGDRLCASIAAASILAKVTRDELMERYDNQYPMYGFARHKGYGTAEHLAALNAYGPCPIHRRTFIPVQRAGGVSLY